MNDEMKMMVNAIIDEIGRAEDRANRRFDKLEERLDAIQHDVYACRLETRIEELEQKTA